MKWTPQEEEILRRMAGREFTAKDVQKVLKSRSVDSIFNKINNMGLTLPGWKPPDIDLQAFEDLTGEVIDL